MCESRIVNSSPIINIKLLQQSSFSCTGGKMQDPVRRCTLVQYGTTYCSVLFARIDVT